MAICVWTGAGVSTDAPAALPLGDSLTRAVIRSLCGSHALSAVETELARAAMEDSSGRPKSLPRLEWVLEHAHRVVGNDALRPLKVLASPDFNDLHVTFAHHLAEGGDHITVNLDPCIENAGSAHGLLAVQPVYLHGSVTQHCPSELLVRSGQLGVGLSSSQKLAVRSALGSSELLVFLGYSGRDYFDVDPFFAQWAQDRRGLGHLTVLWISHSDDAHMTEHPWRHERGLDGLPILRALTELRANAATSVAIHGASYASLPWRRIFRRRPQRGPVRRSDLRLSLSRKTPSRAGSLKATCGGRWVTGGA